MSAITASERFSILKNGVDERLEIICDNETGFYNITKTAKMIKNLLESDRNEPTGIPGTLPKCQTPGENDPKTHDNEPAGIPAGSNNDNRSRENDINSFEKEPRGFPRGSNNDKRSRENEGNSIRKEPTGIPVGSNKCKRPANWFENDTTQDLIDETKQQTGIDIVYYELAKGTPKRFAGTYVHELLYDHFLSWLDSRYAIKISVILKKIHQEANRKLLKEKDDKIDILIQETKQQSAEIQKLLTYAQDTKQELSEARLDIQENGIEIERLNDKVDECRDVIIDRMEEHTLNPKSITKLQYFMCLQHPENDNELYAIRSQKPHIKKQLKVHHDWKILIEPIEDPNSIKMFNRFKDRVKAIENDWKVEIKLQYKKGKIDRESRDSKLEFIRKNPLIAIKRNDIEFDIGRISLGQVIQLMQDTAFERFKLNVP